VHRHLDGQPVKSCTVLACKPTAASHHRRSLEQGGKLHAVQEGFVEKHGLQCGFCTPGMLMTTSALLASNKNPSEQQIRGRSRATCAACTGYVNIIKAVQYAPRKCAESARRKPWAK